MPPNESPIVTMIFEKGASSGRERVIFLLYVKEFFALCMYVCPGKLGFLKNDD